MHDNQSLKDAIYGWLQATTSPGREEETRRVDLEGNARLTQTSVQSPRCFSPSIYQAQEVFHRPTTKNDIIRVPKDLGYTLCNAASEPDSASLLEESPNPFARQLRYKTHEDKYTLKEKRARKERQDGAGQHGKVSRKRNRHETSGTTLLHRYNAANVVPDRLTLRPTSNLGLFRKGKASSPFQQKALFDLAFSEVKFLSKRRHTAVETDSAAFQRKRRKVERITDEEISRFFATRRTQEILYSAKPTTVPEVVSIPSQKVPTDVEDPLFLGFGQPAPCRSTHSLQKVELTPAGPTIDEHKTRSIPSWSRSPMTVRTKLRKARSYEEPANGIKSVDQNVQNPNTQHHVSPGKTSVKDHQNPDIASLGRIATSAPSGFLKELSYLVEKWQGSKEVTGIKGPDTERKPEQSQSTIECVPESAVGGGQIAAEATAARPMAAEEQLAKKATLEQSDTDQRLQMDHFNNTKSSTHPVNPQGTYNNGTNANQGLINPPTISSSPFAWTAKPPAVQALFSQYMPSVYEQQARDMRLECQESQNSLHSSTQAKRFSISRSSFPSPFFTTQTSIHSVAPSGLTKQGNESNSLDFLSHYDIYPADTTSREMYHAQRTALRPGQYLSRPTSRIGSTFGIRDLSFATPTPRISNIARSIYPAAAEQEDQRLPLMYEDTPCRLPQSRQSQVQPPNFWTPQRLS